MRDRTMEDWVQLRREMYSFKDYNPYHPPERELPLVRENLNRLKSAELSLRNFLRQTPQFPRWRDEHVRAARVLLVTNEPGLDSIDKLYGDLTLSESVEDVSCCFHRAMHSWLALSDHPGLRHINGESSWRERGKWQAEYPTLAQCGKAGYFISKGEESGLAGSKVLHLELSPFPQKSSQDFNSRNDRDREYHEENLKTVELFCSYSSQEQPRYIFIMANRARLRHVVNDRYRLEALNSSRKDKSSKILDLLQVVYPQLSQHVRVRLCQHWPSLGREVNVLTVVAAAAYELRQFNDDSSQ